jgi:hypothetical protein
MAIFNRLAFSPPASLFAKIPIAIRAPILRARQFLGQRSIQKRLAGPDIRAISGGIDLWIPMSEPAGLTSDAAATTMAFWPPSLAVQACEILLSKIVTREQIQSASEALVFSICSMCLEPCSLAQEPVLFELARLAPPILDLFAAKLADEQLAEPDTPLQNLPTIQSLAPSLWALAQRARWTNILDLQDNRTDEELSRSAFLRDKTQSLIFSTPLSRQGATLLARLADPANMGSISDVFQKRNALRIGAYPLFLELIHAWAIRASVLCDRHDIDAISTCPGIRPQAANRL